MKWYYTVLIILAVIIVAVLILGIVVDKAIFKGSFSNLIRTLIDAKKGNIDVNLSENNLPNLSDNELNLSILSNIQNRYDNIISTDEFYSLLNENEKTFYVVMLYEIEFQNGGLCQYFVNSSKDTAKYLSEELNNLGAHEIEKEFVRFATENKINLNNLSEFDTDTNKEYMALYELYPFEEYDEFAMKIYEEENLESMLAEFIRDNIFDFMD